MTAADNRIALADALLAMGKELFGRAIVDVYSWNTRDDYHRLAFVGDPLKLASTFGMLRPEDHPNPHLGSLADRAIRRALGVHHHPDDWRREHDISLHEFLTRLGSQTVWLWSDEHGPIGDELRVTFIPEPGYPWPAAEQRYWSSAKQKWMRSETPRWLIQVDDSSSPGKKVPGINPCLVFPADESATEPGGAVCGDLAGAPMMATHAMRLTGGNHKDLDAAVQGIRACGGLLFPSLAVGPIPATNFGPVVLVAHIELITASLLPYRKNTRRRPCWVYNSDAWTETTGSLMRDTASELFEELHGHSDWSDPNMTILGVPAVPHQWGQYFDPLDSTKQLATGIRKRMRGWSSELTAQEFQARSRVAQAQTAADKYAYCEGKAREVVKLDEFPYIIAPAFMETEVSRFVDGVGYEGEVVLVPADDLEEMVEHHVYRDYALYQWAWRAAEVIKGLRPIETVRT